MAVHAERLNLFDYLFVVDFGFINVISSVVSSWRKMTGFLADGLEKVFWRDWRVAIGLLFGGRHDEFCFGLTLVNNIGVLDCFSL